MALKIDVKIEGLEQVRKNFERYKDAGGAAVRTAIYAVANDIMLKSIKITPKADGWLRNTWYVTKPYKRIGFAELGYGADYAHKVHEMPSSMNWSEPGTGNKFLEKPFNERRSTLAFDIATIAKRKLKLSKTSGHFPGKIPTNPATGPKPDSWKKKGRK